MCRHRTLTCVGGLSVPGPCQGSGLTQGDLAWLLGSSGLVLTGVRCSFAEVRTQRCFLGRIILPCHMVPLGLPCGGVGCRSPCDLEVSYGCSAFILQKRVPLIQGTDNVSCFDYKGLENKRKKRKDKPSNKEHKKTLSQTLMELS
jgi:hypothetical protein